jgi:hypothetical protein
MVYSQALHGSSVDCIKFSRRVGEIPGPATEAESAIRMIIWPGERWEQSRVSPTPEWRSGVPCKRSIRDSTDSQRPYRRTMGLVKPCGNGSRSSQGHNGRGKKNEQVNFSTPGNRCVGRPAFKQRAVLVFGPIG